MIYLFSKPIRLSMTNLTAGIQAFPTRKEMWFSNLKKHLLHISCLIREKEVKKDKKSVAIERDFTPTSVTGVERTFPRIQVV